MNRRLLTIITASALGAALILAALGVFLRQNAQTAAPQSADPTDPRLVARGTVVYQQACASCHGANLEGQASWRQRKADGTLPAPPHNGTGHTWHHPDQMLFDLTKWGTTAVVGGGYKSTMPGFSTVLDDGDIWAVLAFIKSRWPPEIQAAHAARQADTRR